ncbi:MAG: rod shape-determining protein MreC, partial [Candidatus Chromulinivorax sp.]
MEEVSLKVLMIRLFFVFLVLFMINRLFFFSPGMAEKTTSYILYPFLRLQKICTEPYKSYQAKKNDIVALQKKLHNLEEENNKLTARIVELYGVIDYEHRSEQVRQFEKKYNFAEQKLVQILMRSMDEAGQYIWVDAGADQGIHVNMIAMYQNNIVGRVIHVDSLYSKVALITDKRCKIAVSCAKTKSVGIYEGHNHQEPTLEFVAHYEKLEVGDIVISTGQGLVYPQGFAV